MVFGFWQLSAEIVDYLPSSPAKPNKEFSSLIWGGRFFVCHVDDYSTGGGGMGERTQDADRLAWFIALLSGSGFCPNTARIVAFQRGAGYSAALSCGQRHTVIASSPAEAVATMTLAAG